MSGQTVLETVSEACVSGLDHEKLRSRINQYAPYLGASIEVAEIAADFSEIRVEMPLVAENANLVGTHFGGSLYAMVDPHLMILLMQQLGPGYTVWDKSATIDFLRPGRGVVSATVRVSRSEVQAIRTATADGLPAYPEWTIEILDEDGSVVAAVGKTLYVRKDPAL